MEAGRKLPTSLENTPKLKSNINKLERDALDSLGKNKDITIVPADKGRAVVVLNTEDYVKKAKSLLSDTQTYKVVPKDPTAKFSKSIVELLQKCKTEGFPDCLYRQVYPTIPLP